MNRRNFLKNMLGGTVVIGSSLTFGDYSHIFAASEALPYDLVAVKGGEPEQMK